MRYGSVWRADGRCLAERVAWMDGFALRLRGLLARPPLAVGEGALLVPCRSVHGFGMGYALDVAYLARDGSVLRTLTLRPGRWGPHVRAARCVLELPAGALRDVAVGETLQLLPPADTLQSEGKLDAPARLRR